MLSPTPFIALGLLSAGIAHAKELAIEAKPFELVHQLDAKVMPAEDIPLVRIEAKAWQSFPIVELAKHGSKVKKGDVLLVCDAREIDLQIAQLKRQLESHDLAIAATKDQLTKLEETADQRLLDAKRNAQQAAEYFEHFTKFERQAQLDEAHYEIERARQWLLNEKEELRQLKQMYEADDLTEDTEEIILTRQKNAVERAELGLRLTELRQTREIEVMMPRKTKAVEEAVQSSAIALKYAERSIPREIEQTKDQLEGLEVARKRDATRLADYEHDRQFFEVLAGADGTFYHGSIEDGEWTTGDLLRGLRVGGSAPQQIAFGSLVPDGAKLELVADTDASKARELATGIEGVATLAGTQIQGAEFSSIPVKLTARSLVPSTQGNYQLSLSADWPKGLSPEVGNPATVHLLVHQNAEAIMVPANALSFGAKGWCVELKLADGKTESRPVVRGAQADGEVEILEGLEIGQVIITP